jgi:hypothetical protein
MHIRELSESDKIMKTYFFGLSLYDRKSRIVTYPAIWRCGVSCRICGCECGGCVSLKEMIHLHWETTASPEGDATSPAGDTVSPAGDLLASPNFGICDTTPKLGEMFLINLLFSLTYNS